MPKYEEYENSNVTSPFWGLKICNIWLVGLNIGVGVRTCLWLYKCPNKCPFWPLCLGVLKHEMQNIQKCGCDHNAHKTYFWRKKRVTDIFWGMAAESNADI
jgi:hypothetical protein